MRRKRTRRTARLNAGVLADLGFSDSIAGQGRAALEDIRDVLNGEKGPELQKELRLLVRKWQDSGPHLMYMVKEAGIEDAMRDVREFSFFPSDRGNVEAQLFVTPRKLKEFFSQGEPGRTKATAIAWFTLLVHNHEWDKLAGPCPRCDGYYIKKRESQKVYCSRKCGNAATAVARTSKRYSDLVDDKLKRARAAIQKWTPADALDWKQFVHRSDPDITPKFLTRAVNKKQLKAPKGGK